jgi:hypothetical protein
MIRIEQANNCSGIFMILDCYARLDSWIAREKGLVPVVKKDE